MDSRYPLFTKRKSRVKCHTIIQQSGGPRSAGGLIPLPVVNTFEFLRFRFHFRAVGALGFPTGKSANIIRGAFGMLLRETAAPAAYFRLFEPGSAGIQGPSGLADWPRPFLFRAAELDGRTIPAGGGFYFDVHVFDVRRPALTHFRAAFQAWAERGIGPRRGRAVLERVEQLDLAGGAQEVTEQALAPSVISLEPGGEAATRVRLRFRTPTELKTGGAVSESPEFAVLFSRLRDRLSTLRALYGAGPLDIDFRAMGERARSVRLEHAALQWEIVNRRSSRTRQVHSIGGFTGEAQYAGPLTEFLPWLRAARWVGVGRQTVWGKGDVRVYNTH